MQAGTLSRAGRIALENAAIAEGSQCAGNWVPLEPTATAATTTTRRRRRGFAWRLFEPRAVSYCLVAGGDDSSRQHDKKRCDDDSDWAQAANAKCLLLEPVPQLPPSPPPSCVCVHCPALVWHVTELVSVCLCRSWFGAK